MYYSTKASCITLTCLKITMYSKDPMKCVVCFMYEDRKWKTTVFGNVSRAEKKNNYVIPTSRDVDSERTSGNLLSSKSHIDNMRPLQNGDIGAPENTVASVLQEDLHRVSSAVGVHNDDADIPCTCSWKEEQEDNNSHGKDEEINTIILLLTGKPGTKH